MIDEVFKEEFEEISINENPIQTKLKQLKTHNCDDQKMGTAIQGSKIRREKNKRNLWR